MANLKIMSNSGKDITSRYIIDESDGNITATRKDDELFILKGSDIISQSMYKINENFSILKEKEELDTYKWSSYITSIDKEINDLKNYIDAKNTSLIGNISGLATIVNNVPSGGDIKSMVNSAINSSEGIISDSVRKYAIVYVNENLAGYAKTSYVDNKVQKESAIISSNVMQQISDAKSHFAQSNMIVANSKFFTIEDNGENFLVYVDGLDEPRVNNGKGHSPYKDIKEFLCTPGALTPEEQNEILAPLNDDSITWPSTDEDFDKILEYSSVLQKFMSICESIFKTVATEMASITETVSGEVAAVDICVKKGDQSAGMVFTATDDNSSIVMMANNFGIQSDNFTVDASTHKVTVKGNITADSGKIGNVIIDNDGALTNGNFTLSADGKLTASGAEITGSITATSLTIGSSAETTLRSLIENVGTDKHWGDATEPYPDGWLTNAFSKTEISGGLALTGNLFVADSQNNVTAGIMGGNEENVNDIRFFAGSDVNDVENAKFKVYEDGTLIARNAEFIDGMFSGSLSFPFKDLTTCSDEIANETTIVCESRGSVVKKSLRYIDLSRATSIHIESNDRHDGDWYGCGTPTTLYLVLPSTGVEEGTIINIISPHSAYKNSEGNVLISSNNGIFYATTSVTGRSSAYGKKLESVKCYDLDSSDLSDSTWISYEETFFLRLLYYGGSYYVIQTLGVYTLSTGAPPTELYYDGVGSFNV